MQESASAPSLMAESPYAATLASSASRTRMSKKKWVPPPGAFNEPELPPRFASPGPGKYTPAVQHAVLSTKPRVVACSFGSEDRFKYYSPQIPLERTGSGMLGGIYCPQAHHSPGPSYNPSHKLTKAKSQDASFTVERRDPGGLERKQKAATPGPGMYTPKDGTSSQKKNFTAGGGFLSDDRQRYLGEVDPTSLNPAISVSPGPMYAPGTTLTAPRTRTVAFGGTGPGSMMKPPSMKAEMPGPGNYTPIAQSASLSTKRRVPSISFGTEVRQGKTGVDSTYSYHGSVPVDMRFTNVNHLSPGPNYNPTHKLTKRSVSQAVIGTDRRFRHL